MWKIAVVLSLLSPITAFAGQATGTIRVGFIITGPRNASAANPKTATDPADATTASVAQPTKKPRTGAAAAPLNIVPSIR